MYFIWLICPSPGPLSEQSAAHGAGYRYGPGYGLAWLDDACGLEPPEIPLMISHRILQALLTRDCKWFEQTIIIVRLIIIYVSSELKVFAVERGQSAN
jgi:hypothetical protein